MISREEEHRFLLDDTFRVFSSYHKIYLYLTKNFDAVRYSSSRSINMNVFMKDGRNKLYVSVLKTLDNAGIVESDYDLFFLFMHVRVFEMPEYYIPNQVFFDAGIAEWPLFLDEIRKKGKRRIEVLREGCGKLKDTELFFRYKKGDLSLVELALLEAMGTFKHLEGKFFYDNVLGFYLGKMRPFFMERWYQERRGKQGKE